MMKPELRRMGESQSPVVVIDDFSGSAEAIVEIAAALAPFAATANYYPGVRRIITPADAEADAYVERTLNAAAPFIAGAFDSDGFDLIEASFSMVTARPETLSAAQRAPHFDTPDADHLAVLHYLGGVEGSGTAFYRQRSTGIETVTPDNLTRFAATARRESPELEGYTNGSNAFYDRIGAVEAVPDRLIVYQGRLLHSGIIPSDMRFSADPRMGRLTTNIFVRIH